MIFNYKKAKRLSIIFLIFFVFSPFSYASSQSNPSQNDKGLTLSPVRSEYSIVPGTSFDGVLTISNSNDKSVNVFLNVEEFNVINQQYDYKFSNESDISKWINFENDEVNIESGKKIQIPFKISVPLSAEPGGRYASIFASTETNRPTGDSGSIQRVASLLYLNIVGEVSREGSLISLNSPWIINDKSNWSAAIRNSGTTHFRSIYSVKVYSVFGKEISNSSDDSLILPGTIRLVKGDIKPPILPGFYGAVYTIGLGDTPAVTETRLFLYMPLWATALIVAVTTIFALRFIIRRKKKN